MRCARPAPVLLAIALLGTLASSALAALVPSSFATQVVYPTGAYPFCVVAGDLDHDDIPDLALAGVVPGRATVLLNQGNGVFAQQTDFPAGSYSTGIVIGDFNGDTHPDLAVTNAQSHNVSVLLGVGDGTFGAKTDFGVGLSPYGLATADLDGDGDLDLVTANNGQSSLSVLLGNGNGTFAVAANVTLPSTSRAVAIGDLDGDGDADLVAAISGLNLVSIALGNGNGTFAARQDVQVGTHPFGVTLGDLNLDGHLDIATANADDGSVSVMLGAGNGTFGPRTDHSLGLYPYAVAIRDLDGDTLPELMVAMVSRSKVTVLQGTGSADFGNRLDFATGRDPFSIAVADFNGDQSPDLAVANEGGSSVSVLLNTQIVAGTPTFTTLTSDPNPSIFGQAVTLSATVTPDTVPGSVEFYNGTNLLGASALAGGVATLVLSNLPGGQNQLIALFRGDASTAGSTSPQHPHDVSPAATVATVTSAVNPSYQLQAIRFVATVTVTPPGGGTPTGTIQFKTDGWNIGSPVTLANGSAQSALIDSLTAGVHAITAVFTPGTAADYAPATSEAIQQQVNPSLPVIVEVRDVPNDQGGLVFVTWRCGLDSPGVKTITGYRIWRRVPAPAGTSAAAADGLRSLPAPAGEDATAETFWEALATLPAAQLISYGYTAATTQDSLAGANPWTAFFVQGLTADAFKWYNSPPDSGYSVDNLAPPAPATFVASYSGGGTSLHWSPSRAPDVSMYRLHRGTSLDFVPGPANLVVAKPDTGYFDAEGGGQFCYKLAAVDVHGNLGRFALVSPSLPTAALASLVSAEVRDGRARLRWYVTSDEPVELSVERRGLETPWERIASVSQDGAGFVEFEDPAPLPGARYGYRLGLRAADGAEVRAGEAWIDLPLSADDRAIHLANPAVGGAVVLSFAAPAGRTTRVELFDMAGRAIASEWVPGGLGRRSVTLAGEGRLAPGVYLVRIGLEQPVHRRVVVIR